MTELACREPGLYWAIIDGKRKSAEWDGERWRVWREPSFTLDRFDQVDGRPFLLPPAGYLNA